MDLIADFIPIWISQQSTTISVTGVSLDVFSGAVPKTTTKQLTATVAPANATNKTVNWSSSNTNVATVNSSGLVTGVTVGTATITVTTVDGSFTATFSAQVVPYLWQGTRTGAGLSVTVQGNEITINGTASSNTYITYTDNTEGIGNPSGTWTPITNGQSVKAAVLFVSGTTSSAGKQYIVNPFINPVKYFNDSTEYVSVEKKNTGATSNVTYLGSQVASGATFNNYKFRIEYYLKNTDNDPYVRWF